MQLRELKGRDLIKKRGRERGGGCSFTLLLPQSQKCPLYNASYALRIGVSVISGVPRCFQRGGGGGLINQRGPMGGVALTKGDLTFVDFLKVINVLYTMLLTH